MPTKYLFLVGRVQLRFVSHRVGWPVWRGTGPIDKPLTKMEDTVENGKVKRGFFSTSCRLWTVRGGVGVDEVKGKG